MDDRLQAVKLGDQVFTDGNTENFGAVRAVAPGGRDEIIVYIENGGEFAVPPLHEVPSAHDAKVVLDSPRLEPPIRQAIVHSHESEIPGL